MSKSLKPKQVLFLYGLFFLGDGVAFGRTRPKMSPLDRRPLLEMELIRTEKIGRSQHIFLTDRAWDWLSEHLALPIMEKKGNPSKECAFLAQALLERLQLRVSDGTLTLAEFMAPPKEKLLPPSPSVPETPVPQASAEPLDPEEENLLALSRKIMQETGTDRVFLRDLRPRLQALSRKDTDRLLLSLQRKGKILLMSYQDPLSRTAEDDVAALHLGSVSRHVLRLS